MPIVSGVIMGAIISVSTELSMDNWRWWLLVVGSSIITEVNVVVRAAAKK